MSLAQLKFDDTERVALRVHSIFSTGKHTPAEIAVLAHKHGFNVISLTDCSTVKGITEMIIAGEKLGIYVIPGVEITSSNGILLGHFIDFQNENLLGLLHKIQRTNGYFPHSQEVQQAISNSGGISFFVNSGEEEIDVLKRVVNTGKILLKLQQKLPYNSLHKDYFKRMFWRSSNLSPEEFKESLQPKVVKIKTMRFRHLLDAIGGNGEIPADFQGYPFIIVQGEGRNKTRAIKKILSGFNCPVVSEIETRLYRDISWKIYGMGDGSTVQQIRNLLKFNLDDRLYGKSSAQCLILFFRNPDDFPLREIKKALRMEIGIMTFYRLEYQNYIDTFFTSFVHIPDEENIRYENWVLHNLGITIPPFDSKLHVQ